MGNYCICIKKSIDEMEILSTEEAFSPLNTEKFEKSPKNELISIPKRCYKHGTVKISIY